MVGVLLKLLACNVEDNWGHVEYWQRELKSLTQRGREDWHAAAYYCFFTFVPFSTNVQWDQFTEPQSSKVSTLSPCRCDLHSTVLCPGRQSRKPINDCYKNLISLNSYSYWKIVSNVDLTESVIFFPLKEVWKVYWSYRVWFPGYKISIIWCSPSTGLYKEKK